MARLTPLSLASARVLGHAFGLEIVEVEAMDAGSVNSNFRLRSADGRAWFGRVYEEQGVEGALSELRLLRELSAEGLVVAKSIPLRDGREVAEVEGKPFSLYEWVEGRDLCHALVTESRIRQLGTTVARIHQATHALSAVPEGRFGVAQIRQRLLEIERETSRYQGAVERIRADLNRYEVGRDRGLPEGLIHGDLFRDNVLWREEGIVALLDFESASCGAFVYDIMVCLLAWCYTDSFRDDLCRAFLEGYQEVRPLAEREKAALPIEGAIACLRFATTRIRDFSMRCSEGQTPARDYRRFLQRLDDLEAGALRPILATLSPVGS